MLEYMNGAINPYNGALNPVDRLMMQIAWDEERTRLERYRRAWAHYYGDHPKPLAVKPGKADDNVIVNKARVVVDKSVSFLFGKPVNFQLDETAELPEETYLENVWLGNRKMTLLQKLALNGAVCGHVFVKIVPRDNDVPRLVILDPATVTVKWDDEDIDHVLAYKVQWNTRDAQTGKPIVRKQMIERDGARWLVTDSVSRNDNGRWEQIEQTIWPYAWAPVVDAQNLPAPNEFYGASDLEDDLLSLNESRNFGLSSIARILRYHAHPKTWAKGVGGGDLDASVDGVIIMPNEKAELHNLEMQSDLSASLEYDRRLDEAIHEISRIPPVATGKLDNVGALSGVALQILFAPLIELTETKRQTYGDLLVELNRRLLDLGGFGADLRPRNVWPDLLPRNTLEERQAALLDEQLGIASKRTIASRLGYDFDTEQAQIAEEGVDLGTLALDTFDRGKGA